MYLVASVCMSVRLLVNPHYQSKVFVCVSVISGHMWIIALMLSGILDCLDHDDCQV